MKKAAKGAGNILSGAAKGAAAGAIAVTVKAAKAKQEMAKPARRLTTRRMNWVKLSEA